MITVMTAVYNRKKRMRRLYQSLRRQTDKNFEWLIVDDGSQDQLGEQVESWKKAGNGFPIGYVYQENGGKHRAWNRGAQMASGEYVFVVDSDDYLEDRAIEKIYGWIAQIGKEPKYAGVSGCKAYKKGGRVCRCGKYPANAPYVDASNLRRHPALSGDKAEVYRAELLRQYPFPEFPGERFCPEDAVFHRIARAGYILRWFPDQIVMVEYLEGGLTKGIARQRMKYINGYTYSVKNGRKYDQFPYNYFSVGEYVWTLWQNGARLGDAAQRIEVSYRAALCGVGLFGMQQLRRRIMDKIEKKNLY